ncbi:hypothetical protein GOBAR_AA27358 [Gossypium barbadense]|uniref:Uncharacterized protein n=1 Tax=Gossypium barbadense TaxID=3634 RepID=A0A2P5WQJ0_GOSBA|nr:hypothetical protein GOBAR_AA27358 [Gossypium barbadense]
MGGQVTEEAMNDAISPGKVEFIRFPVEVGTAPSIKQYMTRFASQLASDRLSQDANGSGDHRASSTTEEKLKLQETNELLQETSNGAHKKEASSDDKEDNKIRITDIDLVSSQVMASGKQSM